MNAELHLREPKRERLIVDGNPVTAGKRKLKPAAQCKAMNGGNGGAGQSFYAIQNALAHTDQSISVVAALEGRKLSDVGAGDETIGLGRAQD